MKNSLLVPAAALLLLVCAPARAQFWDPFPLGQKSIYIYQGSNNELLAQMVCMDSVRPVNKFQRQYFFRNYYDNACVNKAAAIAHAVQLPEEEVRCWPDSVDISADSIILYERGMRLLTIYPRLSKGQSTVTGALTHTCITDTVESVLGIADSVKEFRVQTGAGTLCTFKLSKEHGLLSFPALLAWNDVVTMQLSGFKTSLQEAGIHVPSYERFASAFSAGDVRLWKEVHSTFYPSQNAVRYARDSIISSLHLQDSSSLSFTRKWFENGIEVRSENLTEVISRSLYPDLYTAPAAYYALWRHQQVVSTSIYEITEDSVLTVSASMNSYLAPDCRLEILYDACYGFSLSYGLGVTQTYSCSAFSGESTEMKLVAWRKGGVVSGNLHLGLANDEFPTVPPVLYPNPASDVVHIAKRGSWHCTIRDLWGRTMAEMDVNDNIDLSGVRKGMYLVTLQDPEQTLHFRLMKN